MSQRTLVRSLAAVVVMAAVSVPTAAQYARKARPAPGTQRPKPTVRQVPQAPPGMQTVATQDGKGNVEVKNVPATGRFVPSVQGGVRQLTPDEITPAWEVQPDNVGLGADPALKDRKQAVAKTLLPILTRTAPANAGRQAHFQWVARDDSPLIFRGWHARIRDVEEVPGGWHVTLWVRPVAQTKGGTGAIVSGVYVEEYAVDAGGNVGLIRDYPHPRFHGSEGGYISG